MLENGTIIADRYEILGKIGTGGTADVYKAKCHKLNRYVAVKVLKREFSEDRNFISKFRIEAQSAAGMSHPNIVNVYDVGDENGIYYIVMELVEGITLKKYIEKKGALEYREAISIAIQIAQGIEVAHKHNIIHRDIKPQNIIISKEGKVKVTDFGIAKVTTADTVNSMAMGSVHYISPEQARGGFSDVTSDIYSFGITLFEMCTGRVPFDGESTVSVALMHIQNELMPPSTFNPNIPVSLEKIILKCAQKRVDRRYQSATELIADLKRALVSPFEDFVVIADDYDASPTLMFTPEEVNQIKTQTNVSAGPSIDFGMGIEHNDDTHDDEHDDYDENEYEEQYFIGGNDDDDDDDEIGVVRDGNKIDKIMVWLGVAVAVVIVIITIGVLFKVFTTINNAANDDNKIPSMTTTPTVSVDEGVEVPPLIGLTADAAKEELNSRGLGFKQNLEPSDIVQKGLVIGQSVEEGVHVAKNTQIIVTVSSGSKSFELIDVLNQTEAKAIEVLKGLNLNPVTEYEYSNDIEQGNVMKMSPVAGSQVKNGDTVTLVISRGKKQTECVVPKILELDESDAREALDQAGLVAQLGGTASSSTIPAGKGIAQSYPEGTKVAAGTVVEYILSTGKSNKIMKGRVTIFKAWATAQAVPEGFDEENGTKEVQVVFRQTKDGQDYSNEIMTYTDMNTLADQFELTFDGIAEEVSDGNAEVYVRYSWTDTTTGEPRIYTTSVQSIYLTLSEDIN